MTWRLVRSLEGLRAHINAMSPNRSKISNGTIDGVKMTVPDDMAIRHRRMLAEWEAAGNTIVSYVPRAVDLMAYTAQKRWEKEVDGIEIGGIPVHTGLRAAACDA